MLQTKWIADGDHKVTDFHAGRIAQRYLRQIVRCHFQHGNVGGLIAADDRCLQITPVLQRDRDLAGVLHDMRIGDDVALLGIKNDARSGALKLPFARA